MENKRFEIKDQFYLDGKEMKIISGSMHYFRIVPEYWRDRLEKLRNLGCNTVEIYVAWNIHEPKKGCYNFDYLADIRKFLLLAQEVGLWVIVRPSPYICAEFEFGGLPAWLLKEDGMRLRGSYDPFLNHVREYYRELFKVLTPLQINYGGPIILMQIENEYGYYGDDTNYLETLKDIMIENGVVVPMVTSDGPWGDALKCGSVKGAHPTANFGSKADEQFKVLAKYNNGGPLMCMEFWVGWFDSWGIEKHMTSNLEDNRKDLHDILRLGNVNIYMFHGGTNFGFMNGANYYDCLTPDVTSYDYDAVLSEGGNITPKYRAFQEIIKEFSNVTEVPLTSAIKSIAYGKVEVSEKVGLFQSLEVLSNPTQSTYPQSMEKLDQNYGYILYQSDMVKESKLDKIRLWDANDRAQIFLDKEPVITLYDRELLEEVNLEEKNYQAGQLSILIENMGRVNFGPKLEKQRKGIDGTVQVNGHQHFNWKHFPLPLDNLDKLNFTKGYDEGLPAFYKFEFNVEEIGDTYLDFTSWGKGCAFINGFNLGRYWKIGPQKRLYIPGPLIRKGMNEIILFETEGICSDSIILSAEPDLG